MTATMPPPTSPPTIGDPPPEQRRPPKVSSWANRWHWRWFLIAAVVLAFPFGYGVVWLFGVLTPSAPVVTVTQAATPTSQPTATTTAPGAGAYFDYLAVGTPNGVSPYDLTQNAKAMIPVDPAFPDKWDRAVARDIAAQFGRLRTADQCQLGLYVSSAETVTRADGSQVWRRVVTPHSSDEAPRLLQCSAPTPPSIPTTPTTKAG